MRSSWFLGSKERVPLFSPQKDGLIETPLGMCRSRDRDDVTLFFYFCMEILMTRGRGSAGARGYLALPVATELSQSIGGGRLHVSLKQ